MTRAALLILALAAPLQAQDAVAQEPAVFENAEWGLRWTLPEGWAHAAKAGGTLPEHTFTTEADARLRLAIRAIPKAAVPSAEAARGLVLAQVEGAGYRDVEPVEIERAGLTLLGVSVVVATEDPPLLARLAILDHGEHLFLLDTFVQVDALERWPIEALERLWAGFETFEPAVEEDPDADLKSLAARCGSEIDWADTWDAAAERSRAERKPILVHTRIYPGFALSDDSMVGPFMDPHVVDLIRERYVPFRLRDISAVPFRDPELYGLSGMTFGSSLIVAAPDGRVLAEGIGPVYPFLVASLDVDADLTGPDLHPVGDPFERAALLLRRGQHDEAQEWIDEVLDWEDESSRGPITVLRAELAYRRREAYAAYEALLLADELQPESTAPVRRVVDRARALTRMGWFEEAREALVGFLDEHEDHPREAEARFLLGALQLKLEGKDEAEALWRALAAEHPDDRWAWSAAGSLTSTAFVLGEGVRLDWPSDVELASSASSAPAPLGVEELDRVEREALDRLLALQHPSGLWTHGVAYASYDSDENDELRQAITAICGSALLEYRDEPGVEKAIQRALAMMISNYVLAREEAAKPQFMDYSVWSRPYMLAFLADVVDAGLQERVEMEAFAAWIIADLETAQRANGGWSYYVTGDLEGASAPEQSISFTTAAVVLGLVRGGEVGFQVPKPMVDRALDCLEAMRDGAGNFEYFLWEGGGGGGANPEPGAAGRGPVCELALLRGGRTEGVDGLRSALETFVEHRDGLTAEQGKALMHCGAHGQGSHYLMFDYACAAQAAALLPEGEREKFRLAVLEALLAARGVNGGFVDNPMMGWSAGTGLALHALQASR